MILAHLAHIWCGFNAKACATRSKEILVSAKMRFMNCFCELEMASVLLLLKWSLCKCSHCGLKNMVPLAGLGDCMLG